MKRNPADKSLLFELLKENSTEKALKWIEVQADKIARSDAPASLFLAFSQASRYFNKEKFQVAEERQIQLESKFPEVEFPHWDLLQLARTYLLLNYEAEKETWFKTVDQLFETADMYEHKALFSALPLLPYQKDLIERAIDGLRTNISLVFDAIALHNPYPAAYFPEANWNQMILKAIFMQRPIYQVQKLDERRNIALAGIARDFAHERWAAGRDVMPELWRLVVPFLDDSFLKDLERVLSTADTLQIKAALLAIFESEFESAKKHLKDYPEISDAISKKEISWKSIGSEFQLTRV